MWIILSIISALSLSVRDVSIKKGKAEGDAFSCSISMLAILFPFMVGIIFWSANFDFTANLILMLIAAAAIDAYALYLYSSSIQVGQLSVTAPLLAFIPVFQVVLSYLFLGQTTSVLGGVGIAMSITCILFGGEFSIQKIRTNKASIYMLGVAICWSVSSLLHKQGASHFGPLLWTSYVCVVSFILLIGFSLTINKVRLSIRQIPIYWLPALSHFITLVTFYGAAALGNVAYVSSIRRLSGIFSFLSGVLLFNEKSSKRAVVTTLGLIVSAIIISIYG